MHEQAAHDAKSMVEMAKEEVNHNGKI